MADETPMSPISAAEPPKADPLNPAASAPGTIKLNPVLRKPTVGATQTGLKPGLKLPPKPGATVSALRPGLKLPPKPGATVSALKPGLKLPPKPGATVSALKPGLKLTPKPGATVTALKPALKLPTKPVIHKPGEGPAAHALPKPIVGAPAAATAAAAAPAAAAATPAPVEKPVAVDAQGIGKLPTVEMKTIDRAEIAATPVPEMPATPSPMEALKSVTQKLKGITQQIPAQAVLKKTGIIADDAMSASQKEAAKHKTARISLSDAMGVAPVKSENAPMKTIHIKRPIDIGGSTRPLAPQLKPQNVAAPAPTEAKTAEPAAPAAEPTSVTQRKTLKISRPAGGVRPGGKFGIKRPGATPATPATPAAPTDAAATTAAPVGDIPDIANIPDLPPVAAAAAPDEGGPAWLVMLSTIVQLAACVAVGALAYLLFENTQAAPVVF